MLLHVIPYAGALGPEQFILVDDNARPHRGNLVNNFLNDIGMNRMEWRFHVYVSNRVQQIRNTSDNPKFPGYENKRFRKQNERHLTNMCSIINAQKTMNTHKNVRASHEIFIIQSIVMKWNVGKCANKNLENRLEPKNICICGPETYVKRSRMGTADTAHVEN